ncbi:universal stress protein [Paucimonas lemoignei]|nr:universal stress protein [Paucimonas lemoignei]
MKNAPRKPYRRVLIAVDGSGNSDCQIRQAHELAPDAELIVVHAMDHYQGNRAGFSNAFDDELRELRIRQHERALDMMTRLLENCGVPLRKAVKVAEFGHAPELILDKERQFAADLVVIGQASKSWFRRLFFGGTTSRILARTQCDVLIVPAKEHGLTGTM